MAWLNTCYVKGQRHEVKKQHLCKRVKAQFAVNTHNRQQTCCWVAGEIFTVNISKIVPRIFGNYSGNYSPPTHPMAQSTNPPPPKKAPANLPKSAKMTFGNKDDDECFTFKTMERQHYEANLLGPRCLARQPTRNVLVLSTLCFYKVLKNPVQSCTTQTNKLCNSGGSSFCWRGSNHSRFCDLATAIVGLVIDRKNIDRTKPNP